MQIDKYSMYSYMVDNFSHACDDKILVDLQKLRNLNDYNEVTEMVDEIFGDFEENKIFEYPNNIKVLIQKEENIIKIGALQNDKEIFGQGWRFVKESE